MISRSRSSALRSSFLRTPAEWWVVVAARDRRLRGVVLAVVFRFVKKKK